MAGPGDVPGNDDMPMYYKIDAGQRVVVSIAVGTLTDEDIAEHQMRLAVDPDFDPEHCQLVDFTPSDTVRVTHEGLASAAANTPWHPQSRRAFVVKSSVGDSMLRLFKDALAHNDNEIQVFRSVDDAKEWLGCV
jgi:hypothetical protein